MRSGLNIQLDWFKPSGLRDDTLHSMPFKNSPLAFLTPKTMYHYEFENLDAAFERIFGFQYPYPSREVYNLQYIRFRLTVNFALSSFPCVDRARGAAGQAGMGRDHFKMQEEMNVW